MTAEATMGAAQAPSSDPEASPAANLHGVLRHFDLVSLSTGGISRVRDLIVALAANGELVRQGEPGRTVPLGDIAGFVMGQAPPSGDCNTVGVGTVFVKTGEFGTLYPEVREWTTRPLKLAQQGDVLICVVGATIGKLNLAIDCAIGRSVAAIRPSSKVDTRYLYYSLLPFTVSLRRDSRGSAQGVIGKTELSAVQIRLPSLDEQHSIVARVEELMRLCDALEAKQRLADEQHALLTSTLLEALAASESTHQLVENWLHVARDFDVLLDRPEAIATLEEAVLCLALRGWLTQRMLDDGLASHILSNPPDLPEGHNRRRKVLRRSGKRVPDANASELPESWQWVSVQDLYDSNILVDYADGNHGSLYPRSTEFGDQGVIFATAKDIADGRVTWDSCARLNPDRAGQLTKGWARGGDVLLTHNATVGRVARVEPEAGPFLLGTSVTFYRTNPSALDANFLYCAFLSPVWQRQLSAVMEQTTRNQVSIQKQAEFLLPLPPLAEQRRIVARVEELLRLCVQLRMRLSQAEATQSHLAEALVAEVV